MPKSTRGFENLIGRTIVSVDASAVNAVNLTLDNGAMYTVNGENWYKGIPAITLNPTEPE
jgi:hypothetical protein